MNIEWLKQTNSLFELLKSFPKCLNGKKKKNIVRKNGTEHHSQLTGQRLAYLCMSETHRLNINSQSTY